MYEDLAKELKKNTQVIESTFSRFNLKVLQVAYQPYAEDGDDEPDADCDLLVELASLNGNPMPSNGHIKINLYDENGDLIYHDDHMVFAEGFAGYDTYSFMLSHNCKTLLVAKSAKVYMSKNM